MARITGKNGKIRGVLSRTTVSIDTAMTNAGDNLNYTLPPNTRWNPNLFPVIKKNTVLVPASSYTVDYVNGKITFAVANLITDTITINGIEYMTMQDVGDIFNWSLDAKVDTVDATAFQDSFHTKLSSFRGWNATAEGYHVNGYWFSAFSGNEFYVEFYPDAAATERWVGAAFISFGEKVKFDAAVTEHMAIDGTGALVRLTT